ncbi:Phosphoserine transaminase [Blastocladiella emersonii ATCC 22665]|nr:Phosphoserine transaminase [Blastocladiella emersonii ATCC 22665]
MASTTTPTTTPATPRVINLNAGPAGLPAPVLAQAAAAVTSLGTTGVSILCISHRSAEFDAILDQANADLKSLLAVPAGYAVLWMQGGASTQFHAVAANLAARAAGLGAPAGWVADYLVTGTWSQKAAEAARAAGLPVNVVASGKLTNYDRIPAPTTWTRSANCLYTYLCTNETVHGVEFTDDLINAVADHGKASAAAGAWRPLVVADMSSNILSRPVDMSKFDIVFAGAQKNMGPAGVTVVIVRESLLAVKPDAAHRLPLMLDYATYHASNSLYNTPPVYAMYVTGLVLRWLVEHGGVTWIDALNADKAARVYGALEAADHFKPVVADGVRSRMNVVFRLVDDDGIPQDALDKKFVAFAAKRGLIGLPGHRSVGGCRASLYNAVTLDDVDELVSCIKEFDKLL